MGACFLSLTCVHWHHDSNMITKIDYILTPWELAHTMNQPLFFLMAFVKNFLECHWFFFVCLFVFSLFLKSICFNLAFSFLFFFFNYWLFNYSWSLNNTDLNCMGSLTLRLFFSVINTILIYDPCWLTLRINSHT